MSMGERIRMLRETKHLKQSELAEIIGNDSNTISRWEHNKIGIGSAYIMKLAQALDTSADYLLGKTDDSSPVSGIVQTDPPAQERSLIEKSRGKLTYTFKDGEKLELPDTDRGYELFREILMQKAVMA